MRVSPSLFTKILLFFTRKKKKKIFDLITFSRRRHHFSLPESLSSFHENTKQNKTAKRDDILKYTLVADNMLVRAIFMYIYVCVCVCVCVCCGTLRNNDVSICSYSKKSLIVRVQKKSERDKKARKKNRRRMVCHVMV